MIDTLSAIPLNATRLGVGFGPLVYGHHQFVPKIASRDGLFFRNNTKQ